MPHRRSEPYRNNAIKTRPVERPDIRRAGIQAPDISNHQAPDNQSTGAVFPASNINDQRKTTRQKPFSIPLYNKKTQYIFKNSIFAKTLQKSGAPRGQRTQNFTLYKKECLADLVSNLLIAKIGKKNDFLSLAKNIKVTFFVQKSPLYDASSYSH